MSCLLLPYFGSSSSQDDSTCQCPSNQTTTATKSTKQTTYVKVRSIASAMAQSMTTARDIPLRITSTASSSERRITPSWTIAHLKTKLEPVTGIAPSSQKLTLRLPDQQEKYPIEAEDEESVEVGRWPLVAYAEITVRTAYSRLIVAVIILSFCCLRSQLPSNVST